MLTPTVYPQINYEKQTIPTIYLDTCAMVQLSRHEQGICKDVHKQEIAKLYELLSAMRCERKILIPLGNQLQEMGMTKHRENAKQFLYRFTNSELLHPDLVLTAEMKAGYKAFEKNSPTIGLGIHTAFKKDEYSGSPFIIHVAPVYSPEKADVLRCEKYKIVDILNDMKAAKKVKTTFADQLSTELESEFQMLCNAMEDPTATEDAFLQYANEMEKFYRITEYSVTEDPELQGSRFSQYCQFLLSPYHDLLPYIWIRANLWTHLMLRSNKIVQGDNLDIQWASAYLPFVDYAVTDNAFCELLRSSGLAELYGTKVYSFRTLSDLLDDLKSIT